MRAEASLDFNVKCPLLSDCNRSWNGLKILPKSTVPDYIKIVSWGSGVVSVYGGGGGVSRPVVANRRRLFVELFIANAIQRKLIWYHLVTSVTGHVPFILHRLHFPARRKLPTDFPACLCNRIANISGGSGQQIVFRHNRNVLCQF